MTPAQNSNIRVVEPPQGMAVDDAGLFRALAQASPAGIIALDLEGQVRVWSAAVERIYGWTAEEVMGKFLPGLLNYGPELFPACIAKIKQGRSYVAPVRRIRRKDGSEVVVTISVAPVRDAQGRIVGMVEIVNDVTDAQRTEAELVKTNEQLGAVLGSLPVVTYVVHDPNGCQVVYMSDNVADATGFQPGDFLQEPSFWKDHLHPDDAPRVLAHAKYVVQIGNVDTEYRWRIADGSYRWFRDVAHVVPAQGAEPVRMVGVWWDITEQKRTAEALRLSDERFSKALFASPIGMLLTTMAHGCVVEVNDSFLHMSGYERDEVIGRTDKDLKLWVNPGARKAIAQELRAGGSVQGAEIEFRRKSGETATGLFSATPIRGDTEPLVFAQLVDITQRKLLEEAVEVERKRLHALVQATPVGVMFVDAVTTSIIVANDELQRMLGCSIAHGDPLDVCRRGVVHRRTDGRTYAAGELPLDRALSRGESVQAEEVKFEFMDGRNLTALVSATPMYSTAHQMTGAIAILQDMTPLQEVEKLRSQFLGMVSHELRSPVVVIKGAIAMALGSQPSMSAAELRDLLTEMNHEADRLRDMVDNLLDMTRIEAGAFSVALEPVKLDDILTDVLAGVNRSVPSRRVELHVAEDLPSVHADRRRLGQVLTNLLNNGIKFSPEDTPISIDARHDAQLVTVQVGDQGRGIPPDKIPYLFKKFSQVHPEDRRVFGGTGLGLAICKGIVEAHGGRIWAESEGTGKGATFSFTIPVAASEVESVLPGGQLPLWTRVRPGRARTQVLVVDDDVYQLRYMRRSLNDVGCRPILVSNPFEVADIVGKKDPDLVLLDLKLPGMSGFDVLKRIREFSGVPVIVLTASTSNDDTIRALKMGADDFMTKPFSSSELVARMEAVLRRRARPDQGEHRAPFTVGDLTIDFAKRRVSLRGHVVSLTATEYKLLTCLAANAGQVVTHEQILRQVWGTEYSGETTLVRAIMRNLRKKLGENAQKPHYVLTDPRVGYRMAAP